MSGVFSTRTRRTATLAAALICTATFATADKGVQAWGYNLASDAILKFKWDDHHEIEKVVDYNQMFGNACWSDLDSTDSYFKIKVEKSSNEDRIVEFDAKVDSVDGHSTLVWKNPPSGENVMGNIWDQPDGGPTQSTVFLQNNLVLARGFYNAGSKGDTFLQGHDQSYAYLTPPVNNWMTELALADPAAFDAATLDQFSLPGAHDSGMWRLANGIDTPTSFVAFLTGLGTGLPPWLDEIISILLGLGDEPALNAAQASSLTQKDTPAIALKSGIRFFDFRPGISVKAYPGLPTDDYFHIHNFIPGDSFTSFLQDVTGFLNENPGEFVIVNVKDSGMTTSLFTPLFDDDTSPADLGSAMQWIEGAIAENKGSLNPLYVTEYSQISSITMADLFGQQNRLIFYFGTDFNDSYPQGVPDDRNPYDTWDVTNVYNALEDTLPVCRSGNETFTVFQLQDTATAAAAQSFKEYNNIWINSGTSANGSLLLSTKGMWDNQTYPLMVEQLHTCKGMSVMLNDFAGNLLAWNAKTITAQRMNITLPLSTEGLTQQAACSGMNH